jgi:hypothetical protein
MRPTLLEKPESAGKDRIMMSMQLIRERPRFYTVCWFRLLFYGFMRESTIFTGGVKLENSISGIQQAFPVSRIGRPAGETVVG